ncbi:MAG: hypothetical protein ACLGPL_10100 [Acidobacteriota bacterium]
MALVGIGMGLALVRNRWGGAMMMAASLVAGLRLLTWKDRVPSWVGLLFVLALIGNAAGFTWNIYKKVWWYDDVMHFYGGFVASLSFGSVWWGAISRLYFRRPAMLVATVAALALAIGILWEIGEALGDMVLPHSSLIGGVADTVSDLVLDTLGGFLGSLVLIRSKHGREDGSSARESGTGSRAG